MTEEALLACLRANPLDDETRSVYADWLEQQGQVERAAFLRSGGPPAGDAAWRAVVARQPLARCVTLHRQGCAIPWQQHTPTEDDLRRTCGTCQRAVFYIATLHDLERIGSTAARCFTLDCALDEGEAKDLYDRVRPP